MKSVSKREKIMLIVLIVCVVLYGYYRLFLNPVMVKAAASKDNIVSYNNEIAKLKQAAVLNEKLKLQLEELNVQFIETVKVIPQYERDPEIAYNFKGLGDKNSVTVTTVSIAQPTELALTTPEQNKQASTQPAANQKDKTKTDNKNTQNQQAQNAGPKLYIVPVNLSAKGTYSNLKGYITSLETDTRVAEVTSVNLSTDQTGVVIAAISLNYYYRVGSDKGELDYSFNKGAYGKQDLFK